jgi:hypothetical protein
MISDSAAPFLKGRPRVIEIVSTALFTVARLSLDFRILLPRGRDRYLLTKESARATTR